MIKKLSCIQFDTLFGKEVSDKNIKDALNLVGRLDRNIGAQKINLTSSDLKLAVNIVDQTVKFLARNLENRGSGFINEVRFNTLLNYSADWI